MISATRGANRKILNLGPAWLWNELKSSLANLVRPFILKKDFSYSSIIEYYDALGSILMIENKKSSEKKKYKEQRAERKVEEGRGFELAKSPVTYFLQQCCSS